MDDPGFDALLRCGIPDERVRANVREYNEQLKKEVGRLNKALNAAHGHVLEADDARERLAEIVEYSLHRMDPWDTFVDTIKRALREKDAKAKRLTQERDEARATHIVVKSYGQLSTIWDDEIASLRAEVERLRATLEILRLGCQTAEEQAALRDGPDWRCEVIDAALAGEDLMKKRWEKAVKKSIEEEE